MRWLILALFVGEIGCGIFPNITGTAQMQAQLPIEALIAAEIPESKKNSSGEMERPQAQGNEGGGHLVQLPDLAGRPVAEARLFFTKNGFTSVHYEEVSRPSCAPDIVCATSAKPGERILLNSKQHVYVGKKVTSSNSTPTVPSTQSAAKPGTTAKELPPERPRPADFF